MEATSLSITRQAKVRREDRSLSKAAGPRTEGHQKLGFDVFPVIRSQPGLADDSLRFETSQAARGGKVEIQARAGHGRPPRCRPANSTSMEKGRPCRISSVRISPSSTSRVYSKNSATWLFSWYSECAARVGGRLGSELHVPNGNRPRIEDDLAVADLDVFEAAEPDFPHGAEEALFGRHQVTGEAGLGSAHCPTPGASSPPLGRVSSQLFTSSRR